MRLIFARHGEWGWNAGGIYQGWSDVPLSLLGERQARGAWSPCTPAPSSAPGAPARLSPTRSA